MLHRNGKAGQFGRPDPPIDTEFVPEKKRGRGEGRPTGLCLSRDPLCSGLGVGKRHRRPGKQRDEDGHSQGAGFQGSKVESLQVWLWALLAHSGPARKLSGGREEEGLGGEWEDAWVGEADYQSWAAGRGGGVSASVAVSACLCVGPSQSTCRCVCLWVSRSAFASTPDAVSVSVRSVCVCL